jgi:hypothetical protein
MTGLRVEEQESGWRRLEQLAQAGPVLITRNGEPIFVVQEASPEWLEAWPFETDATGDMALDDYARRYGITLDRSKYVQEFPDDAAYTIPPAVD